MDVAEVAARYGVSINTVRRYHQSGVLPAPTGRLGDRPVWDGVVLDYWATLRGWTIHRTTPERSNT